MGIPYNFLSIIKKEMLPQPRNTVNNSAIAKPNWNPLNPTGVKRMQGKVTLQK